GGGQVSRSGVSSTRPRAPASQQTRAAGAAPARTGVVTSSGRACHGGPPSAVCSTFPSTIRHCELRSGDAIRMGNDAVFIALGAMTRSRVLSERATASRRADADAASGTTGDEGAATGAGGGCDAAGADDGGEASYEASSGLGAAGPEGAALVV